MEQLAARRAHNPKVVGSNPAPATKKKRIGVADPFLPYILKLNFLFTADRQFESVPNLISCLLIDSTIHILVKGCLFFSYLRIIYNREG